MCMKWRDWRFVNSVLFFDSQETFLFLSHWVHACVYALFFFSFFNRFVFGYKKIVRWQWLPLFECYFFRCLISTGFINELHIWKLYIPWLDQVFFTCILFHVIYNQWIFIIRLYSKRISMVQHWVLVIFNTWNSIVSNFEMLIKQVQRYLVEFYLILSHADSCVLKNNFFSKTGPM
jgi:hypothetical protein